MTKLNVTMDDELLRRLEDYADENYMTKSGLVTAAVNQYLNEKEVVNAIIRLSFACSRIAENNEIDEEAKKTIKDFETICKVIQPSLT